jgi:hypothetical protein
VIFLFMHGGPSQVDTFDYKPLLQRDHGKEFPGEKPRVQFAPTGALMASPYRFRQHGQSGAWVSEIFPAVAGVVDELCFLKGLHGSNPAHGGALLKLHTGTDTFVRPSMGSWVTYGLGSESDDLPAFVVFTPQFPSSGNAQALFSRMWGSGFLPSRFTGVTLRGSGDPVLYLDNPAGISAADRRRMLDGLGALNAIGFERYRDPEIQTRIAQYEMAFRMQTSVPELTDLADESAETLALYGDDVKKPGTFTHSALMARRLVERGVRVVQILHRGWDQHDNLPGAIKNQCLDTDRATAALVLDLKRRGLLDDTLVVWGGEFGRTVYSQGKLTKDDYGRDHHPRNFCMWMAGAGVKPGISYGETDDFSYNVVANPVHVNDFNATILHLMGIDHERFTFKFQGLDQRLTGVERQRVVREILA